MNQAVFLALLQPGDTFMGLDLAAGGHLTHGSPVNMSGKWFKVAPYGVRRDDQLHRHGRGRAARAEEDKPEADHRRRHRLFARTGTSPLSRDRRRGRRLSAWSTWRISPASSPAASIRRRFRTPMSSPRRRTSRCAARAAA